MADIQATLLTYRTPVESVREYGLFVYTFNAIIILIQWSNQPLANDLDLSVALVTVWWNEIIIFVINGNDYYILGKLRGEKKEKGNPNDNRSERIFIVGKDISIESSNKKIFSNEISLGGKLISFKNITSSSGEKVSSDETSSGKNILSDKKILSGEIISSSETILSGEKVSYDEKLSSGEKVSSCKKIFLCDCKKMYSGEKILSDEKLSGEKILSGEIIILSPGEKISSGEKTSSDEKLSGEKILSGEIILSPGGKIASGEKTSSDEKLSGEKILSDRKISLVEKICSGMKATMGVEIFSNEFNSSCEKKKVLFENIISEEILSLGEKASGIIIIVLGETISPGEKRIVSSEKTTSYEKIMGKTSEKIIFCDTSFMKSKLEKYWNGNYSNNLGKNPELMSEYLSTGEIGIDITITDYSGEQYYRRRLESIGEIHCSSTSGDLAYDSLDDVLNDTFVKINSILCNCIRRCELDLNYVRLKETDNVYKVNVGKFSRQFWTFPEVHLATEEYLICNHHSFVSYV